MAQQEALAITESLLYTTDLFYPVANIVPETTAALALKGSLTWRDTALGHEQSATYIPVNSTRE